MRIQKAWGRKGIFLFRLTILVGVSCLLNTSCNKNTLDGFFIAVEFPQGSEVSRDRSTIIALDPEHPKKPTRNLSKNFFAACEPVLSNNGRFLFFSGKKNQDDPWQIWRKDLQKNSISRVTNLIENCTHPAFLPEGKIVFSRSGTTKNTETSILFTCNMDGSDLQQITFHPHLDRASSVLNDGRILYISNQQYPYEKEPVYMVMRPDGTKSEIFYRGVQGSFPVSNGTESKEGFVYFIEGKLKNHCNGRLMVLNQNRPLFSSRILSEGVQGEFHSVIPLGKNRCLVSYRTSSHVPFSLFEFDLKEQKLLGQVYDSERNVVDPLVVKARKRPRILPSAVDPENPTGLLMSQNINHSMISANRSVLNDTIADRVQVFGLEGLLSEVKVEEDGSFYLKVTANIPIRLVSMNEYGEMIRGPSDWFWMRSNERRGCVGCHADPELSPDNIQPMAVRHPPVIVSAKQQEISNLEETRP